MVVSDDEEDSEQGSIVFDAAVTVLLVVNESEYVVSSVANSRLVEVMDKVDL